MIIFSAPSRGQQVLTPLGVEQTTSLLVVLIVARISEVLAEWRMIFYGKQLLISDQDAPQRKGL